MLNGMSCPYIQETGNSKFFCQRTNKECTIIGYAGCETFRSAFFGGKNKPVRTFARNATK